MPFVPDKPTPGFRPDPPQQGQPQSVSNPQTLNPQPSGAEVRPETKFYGVGHDLRGTMGTPTPELVKEETKNYGDQMPYAGAMAAGAATGGLLAIPAAGLGAGLTSYGVNKLQGDPNAYENAKSDAFFKGVVPEVGGQVLSGIAKGVGGIAGKLGQTAENAQKFQWAKGLLKNEAEVNPALEQELKGARQSFTREQILPRMQEQVGRSADRTIEVNLDQLEGIDPKVDNYVAQTRQAYRNRMPYKDYNGQITPETHEIPMKDALELRSQINKASKFKQQGPYMDPAAQARDQQARLAGDHIRAQLQDADPNMAKLSDELENVYSLRNDVMRGSDKNPAGVFAGTNISKGGKLAQFDELAGTDLRGKGQALDDAQIALNRSRSRQFIGDQNPTAVGLMKYVGAKAKEAASPMLSKLPGKGLARFIGSPEGQTLSQGLKVSPRLMKQISEED